MLKTSFLTDMHQIICTLRDHAQEIQIINVDTVM